MQAQSGAGEPRLSARDFSMQALSLDDFFLSVYTRELLEQCELALGAWDALSRAIQDLSDQDSDDNFQAAFAAREAAAREDPRRRADLLTEYGLRVRYPAVQSHVVNEIFRNIHSLLTHCSNVSKLVWPGPRRQDGEDGEQYVTRLYANGGRDAVIKARAAGRAIALQSFLRLDEHEHALKSRTLRDHLEHFDVRLDEWAAHSQSHNALANNIAPVSLSENLNSWRNFDPTLLQFEFRGESYSLKPLAEAAVDLREKARLGLQELERRKRYPSRRPSR